MSFFARVTTRPPRTRPDTTNAIIMGRKTYESIPERLRPLGKRVSVVVSRDEGGEVADGVRRELSIRKEKVAATAAAKQDAPGGAGCEPVTDAMVSSSLENALSDLDIGYGALGKLGNVFVIGGGEVYATALRADSSTLGDRKVRVVMTNVRKNSGEGYECDTFFPVEDFSAENGWRTASAEEVTEWVGENVPGEWIAEGEVSVQMVGYERGG